jgi:hypothetical protein
VACAFVVAVGGWLLYRYTRATTISDFREAESDRDRLSEENQRLARELHTAREQLQKYKDEVVYAKRSQEIDSQACAQVKASLADLQSEAAGLREQLTFYRGIVAPNEGNAGVRVYDFKVTHQPASSQYRFDLVLIQSVHHDKRVGGHIDIAIQGVRGGQRQTINMSDIADDDARNLVFSFKYFQEFGGTFHLPEGFRPIRVAVHVVPDGGAPTKIEDEYDWAKIQQEGWPS